VFNNKKGYKGEIILAKLFFGPPIPTPWPLRRHYIWQRWDWDWMGPKDADAL